MTLTEGPTTAGPPPVVQLYLMYLDTLIGPMLQVINDHRLPERLAAGPRSSDDLARETGLHQPSLHRLLRSAIGLRVFSHGPDGTFALGPLGHAAVDLGAQPRWMAQAWEQLPTTVATGSTGMQLAHGVGVFEYLRAHPDDHAWFHRGMDLVSAGEPQAVVEAYGFADVGRVADVGGGTGMLLSVLLDRCPHVEGVLFDTPDTVTKAIPELSAFGDRCDVIGGDFFDAVPSGADAYLLSHVVHDWEDSLCVDLLRNVRAAMDPDGRLLVVEMIIPSGDEPHPARMIDMVMLLMTGGMERTEEEYGELLRRAGFTLHRVIPTRTPVSIIEARPA
jgi:hypothetical protein